MYIHLLANVNIAILTNVIHLLTNVNIALLTNVLHLLTNVYTATKKYTNSYYVCNVANKCMDWSVWFDMV